MTEHQDTREPASPGELLGGYRSRSDTEAVDVERVRQLLATTDDPWHRSAPLHVTVSAIVVHPPTRRVLLLRQDRLRVRGHGDPGEEHPLPVALRAGRAESGLPDLRAWPDAAPVHVVVVPVPAGARGPAREHAELRFVLATDTPDAVEPDGPARELRWLDLPKAQEIAEPHVRETLDRIGALFDESAPRTAPYGTWDSPIEAQHVARDGALLDWVGFVDDEVWWTETRPDDGGRNALMRRGPDGTVREALPPGRWDVRNRVMEYGGRPWLALPGRHAGVVFTHGKDQRVYRCRPGTVPVPLSPAGDDAARYCDFDVRGDEVWCLRETGAVGAGGGATRRQLVALPLDGRAALDPGEVRVLAASHHFMTGPRIEPGGRRVAWLGWNHPAMPWDAAELVTAEIHEDGGIGPLVVRAGGDGTSVAQAEWARARPGVLYALTDPDGWWNVHELAPGGPPRNLRPEPAECGEALWRVGSRWFAQLGDGRLAVAHGAGERRLGILSTDGRLDDIGGPYTEWTSLATDGRRIAGVAAGPAHQRAVVLTDAAGAGPEIVRRPSPAHDGYAPRPYRRTWSGPEGDEVHAHVYPPYNPRFVAPAGELPPCLVFAHGGPNSRSPMVRNQQIAFFTSRGFTVLDVQYGGSTGYGRAYRERLRENWGVVDVRDCATAVRALVAEGGADPGRIAVRGASAGGWTATASLVAEPSLYRAGAVSFPVLDAVTWRTQDTHDFESYYLDGLLGEWPDQKDRYRERSPVTHADRIRAPLLLMQGADDAICPPAQADRLLRRLVESEVAHTYLLFEGEGHGFRRATTVVQCLTAELALYTEAFGL